MPLVEANGITIAYERYGRAGDMPVLLIMGLGGQSLMWPKKLVDQLVSAGHDVIAIDNRDVGLSQKFDGQRAPNIIAQIALKTFGLWGRAPYSLEDMAGDNVGLLDALGIEKAHIVGISMGGMIAQIIASTYPEKVASLAVLCSTTGNRSLPRPDRSVLAAIAKPRAPASTKEEAVAQGVEAFNIIGTPGIDHNKSALPETLAACYDRNHYPKGRKRHIAAIIESAHFGKRNVAINAPTLVMHGNKDPLVPFEGGLDVSKTIKGSKFVELKGMGHDLPDPFLPEIAGHLIEHFATS